MRLTAATTFFLSALALATPAPVSNPAIPEAIPEPRHALLSRAAQPDLHSAQLDTRASKPKGSSGGGASNSSAAVSVSPSGALIVGALGVGVVEVLRLLN